MKFAGFNIYNPDAEFSSYSFWTLCCLSYTFWTNNCASYNFWTLIVSFTLSELWSVPLPHFVSATVSELLVVSFYTFWTLSCHMHSLLNLSCLCHSSGLWCVSKTTLDPEWSMYQFLDSELSEFHFLNFELSQLQFPNF